MPQPDRDESNEAPDALEAACDAATARTLLPYDHHRVSVAGREGVLLSSDLFDLPEGGSAPQSAVAPPTTVRIVFRVGRAQGLSDPDSRRAVQKHPRAPDAIQAAVARLFGRP